MIEVSMPDSVLHDSRGINFEWFGFVQDTSERTGSLLGFSELLTCVILRSKTRTGSTPP